MNIEGVISQVFVMGRAISEKDRKTLSDLTKKNGQVVAYSYEDAEWRRHNGVGKLDGPTLREINVGDRLVLEYTFAVLYSLD